MVAKDFKPKALARVRARVRNRLRARYRFRIASTDEAVRLSPGSNSPRTARKKPRRNRPGGTARKRD
jgi:hypothetical protein